MQASPVAQATTSCHLDSIHEEAAILMIRACGSLLLAAQTRADALEKQLRAVHVTHVSTFRNPHATHCTVARCACDALSIGARFFDKNLADGLSTASQGCEGVKQLHEVSLSGDRTESSFSQDQLKSQRDVLLQTITQLFQLLQEAIRTLKDSAERRANAMSAMTR